MTFREKLMIDDPKLVDDAFYGGCSSCPLAYGYESTIPDTCDINQEDEEICRNMCKKCWDREIPGPDNK